jgi:hypothetical protein
MYVFSKEIYDTMFENDEFWAIAPNGCGTLIACHVFIV